MPNALHITRNCHPYVHVYKLKRQVLDSLHSVKYLGVYLSDDLRWNEHVKRGSYRGITVMQDWLILFSVKHEFNKLFFLIRDLKVLRDP